METEKEGTIQIGRAYIFGSYNWKLFTKTYIISYCKNNIITLIKAIFIFSVDIESTSRLKLIILVGSDVFLYSPICKQTERRTNPVYRSYEFSVIHFSSKPIMDLLFSPLFFHFVIDRGQN
jgi:hypothetical protein